MEITDSTKEQKNTSRDESYAMSQDESGNLSSEAEDFLGFSREISNDFWSKNSELKTFEDVCKNVENEGPIAYNFSETLRDVAINLGSETPSHSYLYNDCPDQGTGTYAKNVINCPIFDPHSTPNGPVYSQLVPLIRRLSFSTVNDLKNLQRKIRKRRHKLLSKEKLGLQLESSQKISKKTAKFHVKKSPWASESVPNKSSKSLTKAIETQNLEKESQFQMEQNVVSNQNLIMEPIPQSSKKSREERKPGLRSNLKSSSTHSNRFQKEIKNLTNQNFSKKVIPNLKLPANRIFPKTPPEIPNGIQNLEEKTTRKNKHEQRMKKKIGDQSALLEETENRRITRSLGRELNDSIKNNSLTEETPKSLLRISRTRKLSFTSNEENQNQVTKLTDSYVSRNLIKDIRIYLTPMETSLTKNIDKEVQISDSTLDSSIDPEPAMNHTSEEYEEYEHLFYEKTSSIVEDSPKVTCDNSFQDANSAPERKTDFRRSPRIGKSDEEDYFNATINFAHAAKPLKRLQSQVQKVSKKVTFSPEIVFY